MSLKKRKSLLTPIYQALVVEGLDQFTVKGLRDAYIKFMNLSEGSDEAKDAHKKVYRQIVRLQRNDLIEKVLHSDGSRQYRKTPKFHETNFVEKCLPTTCDEDPAKSAFSHHPIASRVLSELKLTARKYHVDLMTTIAEKEEYHRLTKEYPAIRHLFDNDYQEAREKSSKLLGQLKAIETVITQHSQGV